MMQSVCLQIWKTQQWSQDWKRSVFILIPKKGNAKERSNYWIIALISHTSKVMLKILQARLQQDMNHELPDVQARFRKGRATEKAMAPHSSTLVWKIPWMEEPGRLQSMGSQRVQHDWVTELSWLALPKLSSGHRTGKGQFSLQSQRKAMTKNVWHSNPKERQCQKNAQTTAQLHPPHTLAQ